MEKQLNITYRWWRDSKEKEVPEKYKSIKVS